jgi:hypothetical protein
MLRPGFDLPTGSSQINIATWFNKHPSWKASVEGVLLTCS